MFRGRRFIVSLNFCILVKILCSLQLLSVCLLFLLNLFPFKYNIWCVYLFNPFIPVAAAISLAPQRVMCVCPLLFWVAWLGRLVGGGLVAARSLHVFSRNFWWQVNWWVNLSSGFCCSLMLLVFLRCRCHYYFLTFMTKTYFLGQFWATEGCGILRDPYVCYMLYFMLCVRLYYDVKLFISSI